MELQKMRYKLDNKLYIFVCAVDSISHGGEYTLCGNAIPDTTMKDDESEHIGDSYNGKLKEVTCPNCMRFIKFIKEFN